MNVTVNYQNDLSFRPSVFLILDDDTLTIEKPSETFFLRQSETFFSRVKMVILCDDFVCEYEFYKFAPPAFMDVKIWGHYDFPSVSINEIKPFTSRSSPRNCCCTLF